MGAHGHKMLVLAWQSPTVGRRSTSTRPRFASAWVPSFDPTHCCSGWALCAATPFCCWPSAGCTRRTENLPSKPTQSSPQKSTNQRLPRIAVQQKSKPCESLPTLCSWHKPTLAFQQHSTIPLLSRKVRVHPAPDSDCRQQSNLPMLNFGGCVHSGALDADSSNYRLS